jgi:hypothetical protein
MHPELDPFTDNDLDTAHRPEGGAVVIGFVAVAFCAAAVGAAVIIFAKLVFG